MNWKIRANVCILSAVLLASGCATTNMSPQQAYNGPRLAKPGRILVYPFVADPAQLDPQAAASGNYGAPTSPATPEQLQVGRQLGQQVASRLVDEINDMGMTAYVGGTVAPPEVNDIVIRGYFASIDEGSAAKRMVIGFGSGKAELNTVVEGYVQTPEGLRQVGQGTVGLGRRQVAGPDRAGAGDRGHRESHRPAGRRRGEGGPGGHGQLDDRGLGQAHGGADRRPPQAAFPAGRLDLTPSRDRAAE